jgi:hypothetical protein
VSAKATAKKRAPRNLMNGVFGVEIETRWVKRGERSRVRSSFTTSVNPKPPF